VPNPIRARLSGTHLRLVGLLLVAAVASASWILTCGAWRYSRVVAGTGPLEPRVFAGLTAVAVGTGSAYENPARRGPCTAVGLGSRVVLVDAGRAVAEGLRAAEIPASQPEAIYLTHLFPENTAGLDDLLHAAWLDSRSEPLRLVGPPGTGDLAESLRAAHQRGLAAAAAALGLAAAAGFEVEEVAADWSETRGELRALAAPLPGGPTPALAWRFEARGRSLVVSGTGWAPDALVAFARGADLLVHEAAFSLPPPQARSLSEEDPVRAARLQREAALHTSVDAVGALAARAGVGTLALVRLRPPPVYDLQLTSLVGRQFAGRILVLSDGDSVTP
jgi:ribonuclease Z